MFAYADAHENTPEINFTYLGNKKIYYIQEMLYNFCFISLKSHLFHNFIFFLFK
jgi:hypothetical protein